MSNKNIRINTIVEDFLRDRLSDRERYAFLEYYDGLKSEDEAGQIFEEIQSQIDALTEADLHLFFSKLDAANKKTDVRKTPSFRRLAPLIKYAAAIVVVVGLAFMYTQFFRDDSVVRFTSAKDELLWLPDSSRVLLKAGSKLSYHSSYGLKNRSINLDGEAFFEVTPNRHKAFVVRSESGFYTKVLGTSFLMNTRPESERVEVKTGRVQVGKGTKKYSIITAGETLYTHNNQIIVNRNRQSAQVALLHFTSETLEGVATELMLKFNQKIILDESVPEGLKYTATFSSDQSLEEILNVLCDLHGLSYTVEPNTIIISK